MPSALSPKPNLEHLKKQAKDLLRFHRSGDLHVCKLIQKYLPRFAQQSDQEILSGRISLHDAQYVVARRFGFDHWAALREEVTQRIERGAPVPTLEKLDVKLRNHIESLGFGAISSYRIWCRKQGLDRGLDKTDDQLQLELEQRLEGPPDPVQSHR